MLLFVFIFITSVALFFFSYLWTDFAIIQLLGQSKPQFLTLLNYIKFGDLNRVSLAYVYLLLIGLLFVLQYPLLKLQKNFVLSKRLLLLTAVIIFIFSFAYPFLSRDIYSYMFTAKIYWVYNLNPYQVSPSQIQGDLWGDPVHNVQNVYQYPIVYLLYSLVPMIIFSGKSFLLNFLGLKFMNAILYFLTGLILYKITGYKLKIFSIWFFNPFLIYELLINAHNDLLMIFLFILSVFFLYKKIYIVALVAYILSVFTKYFSAIGILIAAPFLFQNRFLEPTFKFLCIFSFIFLQFRGNNIWYYTWIYMFLPFVKLKNSSWMLIHLMGVLLLLNYLPLIQYGHFRNMFAIAPNSLLPFLFALVLANEMGMLKRLKVKNYLPKSS